MTSEGIADGKLITVDWGTSNFRAALLDASGAALDRIQAPKGMLQLEKPALAATLTDLLEPWLATLPDAPILMAGMIGSADGLVEVPYLECPASLDDIAEALAPIPDLEHGRRGYIVPGLRGRSISGAHDVMRGEEIQILGALQQTDAEAQTVCLPGTHSKWVTLDGRRVTAFSTCMTGDVYAALCSHTLLKRYANQGSHDPQAFRQGLEHADQPGGLLHHLFSTRTEVLIGDMPPNVSAAYLSGLLIGSEVRAMVDVLKPQGTVTLIANSQLTALYAEALDMRGIDTRRVDGDTAATTGMHHIARRADLIRN
ncbi:2-dehydro-3-deoxygalactonokinase [Marinobacter nanhaiticus D15-8W]|uniref:2-dehydro-3-deoxygalactonokinase n=1 Tax=Marinobacter nanhaiticus D15-8W TaxID=626887 RepID=N6W3S1_9GAMM|nr:2-dehydro-3-deoxygalactonokinase [Marinobacter nanhaiticus]ENO14769.1 2-dehydro-3-deoxygalactonokinase [Marinobacter nanhaiticus D15-8W]BES69542.1 2-dehydro-3-deoxygalactonokinase [Marinobacter nanhaiticus D15-8W]